MNMPKSLYDALNRLAAATGHRTVSEVLARQLPWWLK
jgi:hypothetical protein